MRNSVITKLTIHSIHNLQRDLEGHISDVNTCKFFPSGKVVLSGGADLRLKIWSTEDGSCPVTLKGHTGGQDFPSCTVKLKKVVY